MIPIYSDLHIYGELYVGGKNRVDVGSADEPAMSVYGYIRAGTEQGEKIGPFATIEGSDNVASGYAAHAEGSITEALHDYSHASGTATRTTRDCQTVVGMYNKIDDEANTKALFLVGRGSSKQARLDAFAVNDDGTFTFGDYEIKSTEWSERPLCAAGIFLQGRKIPIEEIKKNLDSIIFTVYEIQIIVRNIRIVSKKDVLGPMWASATTEGITGAADGRPPLYEPFNGYGLCLFRIL